MSIDDPAPKKIKVTNYSSGKFRITTVAKEKVIGIKAPSPSVEEALFGKLTRARERFLKILLNFFISTEKRSYRRQLGN